MGVVSVELILLGTGGNKGTPAGIKLKRSRSCHAWEIGKCLTDDRLSLSWRVTGLVSERKERKVPLQPQQVIKRLSALSKQGKGGDVAHLLPKLSEDYAENAEVQYAISELLLLSKRVTEALDYAASAQTLMKLSDVLGKGVTPDVALRRAQWLVEGR